MISIVDRGDADLRVPGMAERIQMTTLADFGKQNLALSVILGLPLLAILRGQASEPTMRVENWYRGDCMKGSHALMRSGCRFTSLIIVAFLSGCICNDGGFVCHVDGRVMDTNESPLSQRSVAAYMRPFPATVEDECDSLRTDDEGRLLVNFRTGLTWGYTELFGLIPLGSTKGPAPPRLETLYPAVRSPPGTWQYAALRLTKEQQRKAAPAERWISLGDIRMSAW